MEYRWLSVEENRAYLGVTKYTIYNWLCEWDLPAHKTGRLCIFNKEDAYLCVKKQAKTIGNLKK